MKQKLFNASMKLGAIDQRHIKVTLALISLTLFALGASAPGRFSDF